MIMIAQEIKPKITMSNRFPSMNFEKCVSFSKKERARNVPFIRKKIRKAVAPISGELAVFRFAKIVTTVR